MDGWLQVPGALATTSQIFEMLNDLEAYSHLNILHAQLPIIRAAYKTPSFIKRVQSCQLPSAFPAGLQGSGELDQCEEGGSIRKMSTCTVICKKGYD